MPAGLASKVLVDSNCLIYALEQKSDIRDLLSQMPEITGIIVPECVLIELRDMSRDVKFARGALSLARNFQSIEGSGPADDCLLKIAAENNFFILTNDRGLLSRARKSGIRTLTFKQNKRIEFT